MPRSRAEIAEVIARNTPALAIHLNEPWGMAEEHGRWEGTVATKEGPLALAGVYAAKWHDTAEGWRLQAELFTPLVVSLPSPATPRRTG